MATVTETLSSKLHLGDSPSIVHHKEPLKLKGVLDKYESFDVTPILGKEFPKLKITELLEAPNSDELLRDLAITSMRPSIQLLPRRLRIRQSLSVA